MNTSNTLQSYCARTGKPIGDPVAPSNSADINLAVGQAHEAFQTWRSSSGEQRAFLLSALAEALDSEKAALISLADEETGLGVARLTGELSRTVFQLQRFARIAAQKVPFAFTDDPAVPGPPPYGHPAMVRVRVPVGPVAMFAASNFPFAFSVLGGDTASALAAGCSVVVKAHPGHPRLSQLVFATARSVMKAQELPDGLIGLTQGTSPEVGVTLIRHPGIAVGAFTGSLRGGVALQAEANSRDRPIPFYGELGSINPVVALPAALQLNGDELINSLASSIVMGSGQFCTNPGLIILMQGPLGDVFVAKLVKALSAQSPHAMLTVGMRRAFSAGIRAQISAGATALCEDDPKEFNPSPFLAQVDAHTFLARQALHEEIFGPSSLIVRVYDEKQVLEVLNAVGGSLTVTLWGADEDTAANRQLVQGATAIAGRVLFSGVPTGVAVSAAQHHGGPWPSSTQPMWTSVGDAALDRFLRPVALQDAPAWLLARQGQPC